MRLKYSLLFLATYAFALPINPNFVEGAAKLDLINVNELKIDVSHNSVIEWDDFSILENERVEFCQPSRDSSVLNRVVMPNPSHILGTLKANGNVLIINPHGIVFGEHAQIDTGSLVAAAFDLQNDVNSRTKHFTSSASIQHFGSVQARGDVVLFAKELKNLGQITSNYGSIDLISDPNFFSENYHDLIATEDFVVNQMENTLFNNGLISIKSSGQTVNLYSHYLTIGEKSHITAESGNVTLKSLNYSDQPTYPLTYIAPDAYFSVSGVEDGNGGDILFWSDGDMYFHGDAFAEGGSLSGDGGTIEVSGLRNLSYKGTVSTLAKMGETGTFILDPIDLMISAGVSAFVTAPPPAAFTVTESTAGGANLDVADLATALASNNVRVQTGGGTAGSGNITWGPGANLAWGTNFGLTVLAHNNLTVQSNIENNTGPGNAAPLVFVAGWDGVTLAGFAGIPASYGNNTGGFGADLLVGNTNVPVRVYSVDGTVSCFSNNMTVQGGFVGSNPPGILSSRVSIGSRNGLTTAFTRNNLSVLGGIAPQCQAQLGFRTNPAELTAFGEINVDVGGVLTINAGPNSQITQASIGHIGGGFPGGGINFGGADSDITVIVRNQLGAPIGCSLQAGQGGALPYRSAQIGHGGQYSGTNFANGDVTLTVLNGDLLLRAGVIEAVAQVGMGGWVAGGVNANVQSDLTVLVPNGNISILPNLAVNGGNGTFSPSGIMSFGGANITGSVHVESSGDITINAPQGFWSQIGAYCSTGGLVTLNIDCPVFVSCCGNMNLQGSSVIGQNKIFFEAPLLASVSGDVVVAVGNNLTLSPNTINGNAAVFTGIGTHSATVTVGPSTDVNSRLFVLVGGDLEIIASQFAGIFPTSGRTEIFGTGDTNIAVGGNFLCRAAFYDAFIGSRYDTTTCQIRAVGDIIFQNGQLGGEAYLGAFPGMSDIFGGLVPGGAVSASAGGDVVLSSSVILPNLGASPQPSIFVEAGAGFGGGALWTTTGNSITSINGVAMNFTLLNGVCPTFSASSPVIADDLLGAARFDTARYNLAGTLITPAAASIVLQTLSGDITLLSNPAFQTADANYGIGAGSAADLIFDTGVNELEMRSTDGDLFVASYRDTFVRDTVSTTTGNITIITQNDMNLEAGSLVTAGGNVDLVVDNAFPVQPLIGPGAFNMDAAATINSGAGYIRLYTAMQGLNNIDPAAQFISGGVPSNFTTLSPLFQDSAEEMWCTYYPGGSLGVPFRIFYKDCLEIVTQQAQLIISEALFVFNGFENINFPYFGFNEYYGWPSRFILFYHHLFNSPISQLYEDVAFQGYYDHPPEKFFLYRKNEVLVDSEEMRERLEQKVRTEL